MPNQPIKIAIIGVGNCASSLLQGLTHYNKDNIEDNELIGLMHPQLGGYAIDDIEVVAAFDIDSRKVGCSVGEAIFAAPNCALRFVEDVIPPYCTVSMGNPLDGLSEHTQAYAEDKRIKRHDAPAATTAQVVEILQSSGAKILINYLPVGSQQATEFYADCALKAGCAFINNIPVFIASSPVWQQRFIDHGLPVLGDDIKSQFGATIIHRTLVDLLRKRGVKLHRTYQLNTGGNTDFLNMLNHERLSSKKISKTEAVQSVSSKRLDDDNIHIGPSDYVPWQKDNKLCFMRLEASVFGNVPVNLELRLSVEDSPNSAGISIDSIRCAQIALDRGLSGNIEAASAYYFKHPAKQYDDPTAYQMVEDFINQSNQ